MKNKEFFRIAVLCVVWTIALVLLLCEGESVKELLVAKGIGFALAAIAMRVGGYWMGMGMLPWTREITREE